MRDHRLGFIGIGKMGAPMARRLLAAGFAVVAHDVDARAVQELVAHGAEAANSPAEVARRADRVITMLPDGPAVEAVVYGADGLLEALSAHQTVIEMTSSSPGVTRRVARDLAARGAWLLDAPVSGGVRGAAEGTLTVMVGGPAQLLESCRPVLACFSRDAIVHIGPRPGDGDTAKTINNLLSAMTVWGASEAVALGVKAGLAPERLIAAINRSSGRSHTTEAKFPRYVLNRTFDAGFTVGQYLKDLNICLEFAAQLGVAMPLGATLRQTWRIAAQEGMDDEDHTAVIRLLERWAGVQVGPAGAQDDT